MILLEFGWSISGWAQEPLAPITSVIEHVNLVLDTHWRAQGITPAERADDATFLRRLSLDLTERIPTIEVVKQLSEAAMGADYSHSGEQESRKFLPTK